MASAIPRGFKSLQEAGSAGLWTHQNYYYWRHASAGRAGITKKVWRSLGFRDDTLWVHPTLPNRLYDVARAVQSRGYLLLIRDAWRPVRLYQHIIDHHRRNNPDLLDMFDGVHMPHATGMAVDAILADTVTKKPVWTRNQLRDGKDSCFVGFYRGRVDEESRVYQARQDILVHSFLRNGFQLGGKEEYWHFESLGGIESAQRF